MAVADPRAVEIRWTDVDAYGHVHHVAQIAILEHARTPFLDSLFASEGTWDYAIVRIEIDYRGELRYEDREARCSFEATAFGRSSITLRERIAAPDGRPVAEATVVIVAWDAAAGRPRPLDANERAALAASGAAPAQP